MSAAKKYLALMIASVMLTATSGCGKTQDVERVTEKAISAELSDAAPVLLSAATGTHFSDVPEDAWYAAAVQYVSECGLMVGTSDDKFSPDATFTRAQLATVLYRAAQEPSVTGEDSFTDTEPGAWYSDAVLWAEQNDIVGGIGDGLFGTSDPVTQEQLATMLWRMENEPEATDASDASSYAAKEVGWAHMAGIAPATVDYTFAPNADTTRAQVAVLLHIWSRELCCL